MTDERMVCPACHPKRPVDMKVVDTRRIFYGHVWTLRCAKGHTTVEWRKEAP